MKDIVTEKHVGKSKYEEKMQPFEKELNDLCVEYGKKIRFTYKSNENNDKNEGDNQNIIYG